MKSISQIIITFLFICLSGFTIGCGDSATKPAQMPPWVKKLSQFHQDIYNGNLEKVRQSLNTGANVNDNKNESQASPLLIAAYAGHIEIVHLLVSKGASVNAKNNKGKTPLNVARNEKMRAVLRNTDR